MPKLEEKFTSLVTNMSNNHPEDGINFVPYFKGSIFLDYLEELVGGSGDYNCNIQYKVYISSDKILLNFRTNEHILKGVLSNF